MRKTTVRFSALVAVLALGTAAFGQSASQEPKPGGQQKKAAPPAAAGLEDLLNQALKNNPDIRVGEAKVREAEAELNRTRMAVAQKVTTQYHAIDIARKVRDEAKARFDTSLRLYNIKGAVETEENMRTMKLTFERSSAELAKLEAEMPALLGKLPGALGDKLRADAGQDTNAAVAAGLRYLRLNVQMAEAEPSNTNQALALLAFYRLHAVRDSTPQGSLGERIRKALDKQITADYKDKPMADVLKEFEKHLDGIPFRNTIGIPTGKMDLNLGQVPLGTVIQAFIDLAPEVRFVVRDYGILVTQKGDLPPGALELHEFWKSDPGKDKPKADSGGAVKPKQ